MRRFKHHQGLIENLHNHAMGHIQDHINDAMMQLQDETEAVLWSAIKRGGLDLSECRVCRLPVVCIPDGLSNWCEECAKKEAT